MTYRHGWFCVSIVLCGLLLAGWQDAPALSLTAAIDDEASEDERVVVNLTVTNRGDTPLEQVVVEVAVPDGVSAWASAAEAWLVAETPPGTVRYENTAPLAGGASDELNLILTILPAAVAPVVLDNYRAVAEGIDTPVAGEALTLWDPPTPTAAPTSTPTPVPTSTPTPPATATPEPTRTPQPTATTPPSPTPTVTIVPGVLPTEALPTPTPNLSSEQVRIGTWTVSIFVALVLIILISTVIWVIRSHRSS